MKLIEMHRLFKTNTLSKIGKCYLLNLPAILRYPDPSDSYVKSMLQVIKGSKFDTPEQVIWQDIRLLILEPEWLRSTQRKKHHQTVFSHIIDNPHFVQQILCNYELVSLFEQTPHHQESLLFSMCCLQKIIHQIENSTARKIQIWTEHIYKTVLNSPHSWKPLIEGADWLIEELQIEHGVLYKTLSKFSTIEIPALTVESAINSSIDLWAQQQKESDLLEMRDQMTKLDGIIRDAFSKLGRSPLK